MKMITKLGLSIFIGVFTLWLWNHFSGTTYNTTGSLDILSGAIIEFFLFTLLLEIYQNRQAKAWKNDLAKHLEEIEKLLRKEGKA